LDCIIKKGKDKFYNTRQTGVVYEIDCNDCNACFIRQISKHLITRIKEHQADIKKHSNNNSVISKHRSTQNHDFDWLNPKILHKEKHTRRRGIAEMIFIKNNNNFINLQKDTEELSAIYDKIIRIL